MHPLAHMLAGAVIGQAMPTPAGALVGGVFSHYVLDVIPHTEGKTFRPNPQNRPSQLDLVEAAGELIIGAFLLALLRGTCPGIHSVTLGLGVLGALLPDLIDVSLQQLFNVTALHHPRVHWTVTRPYAVLGIMTQILVIGAATAYLWWVTQCS